MNISDSKHTTDRQNNVYKWNKIKEIERKIVYKINNKLNNFLLLICACDFEINSTTIFFFD